jgi:hypothetical protein
MPLFHIVHIMASPKETPSEFIYSSKWPLLHFENG